MTTATAYFCEDCDKEIRFHGGRHKPRWCAGCRPYFSHEKSRAQAKPRSDAKPRFCTACETQLLKKSGSGLCLFCEIESGMREPV